jgi:hypothetical protein
VQDSSADPDADPDDLHAALSKAHEQLDSLETDVQSLEFVAGHPVFEDVCDLDMHYNNPHLEVRQLCNTCYFVLDTHDLIKSACPQLQ